MGWASAGAHPNANSDNSSSRLTTDAAKRLSLDVELHTRTNPSSDSIAVWVTAAPFRAHVRHLMEVSGLPLPAIAARAGVSRPLVEHLLFGRRGRHVRRISPHSAQRLLAVTPAALQACRAVRLPAHPMAGGLPASIADGSGPRDAGRSLSPHRR